MVNDVAPGKRDIAMVFQSYALYPHMSVHDNIAYPLKKRGVREARNAAGGAAGRRVAAARAAAHRKPRQLSGGQQQRVALGRALVREPKVFLLDEPLSNLDAKLRGYMRVELVELHRRLGRTMVYVTHDQLEAMTMSDRIAVMESGRLQQFAPPREIYREPANRFVAGFIGTPAMTLVDGTLRHEAGAWVFEAPGLSLPCPPLGAGAEPGPAGLGVRPEAVSFNHGPIAGIVRVTEQAGHETIVVVEIAEGLRLTGRAPADVSFRTGDRIACAIDSGAAHIFAAGPTGARLNRPLADAAPRQDLRTAAQGG